MEATKAFLIRAVCATLAARLVWWTGLCLLGGVGVFGLEAVELEVAEEGVLGVGAAVDCAATAHATVGNVSSITRVRGAGRILGRGEGKPCIILLYSELDVAGRQGNQWRNRKFCAGVT